MTNLNKQILCFDYDFEHITSSVQPFNPLNLILEDINNLKSVDRIIKNKIKLINFSPVTTFNTIEPGALVIGMALFRDDNKKPFLGDRGTDDQRDINEDLYELSTWLILPQSKKILCVYEHFGCKKNHLEEFINHFLEPQNYKIKITPMLTQSSLHFLEHASRISEIEYVLSGAATVNMDNLNIEDNSSFLHSLLENIINAKNCELETGLDKHRYKINISRNKSQTPEHIINIYNFLSIVAQNEELNSIMPVLRVKYKSGALGKSTTLDLINHNHVKFPIQLSDTKFNTVRDALIREYINTIKGSDRF